jgi:Ca2+-binding RTX toxin-like protein
MTTVNYLTKTELPHALNTGNLDPGAQQAIINQLIADGLYTAGSQPHGGPAIWVESDIYNGVKQSPLFDSNGNPTVPGFVQLLEVEGKNVNVLTDSALKVIVDDGKTSGTNTLTVTGNADELIVLGNSNTHVLLRDLGNDTVLGGAGNDTLNANNANDSLVAGSGNTLLQGGGGQDTMIGGSGQDTLTAGIGQHSWLQAGSGNTVITDKFSKGTDTLIAGSGQDTLTGVQGDYFGTNPTMAASGKDVYNIYDGPGNSTLNLGSGHDTVNFFTTAGNDTINNAHGVDTIDFTKSSTNYMTDIKTITPGTGAHSGDYLIQFTDGQSVLLNGHADPSNKDAFVLDFKDGTMHLKGGS